MEKQLQEILNTLYEAEGLLELALRRSTDTRGNIVNLACSKCFHAADLASALSSQDGAADSAESETKSEPDDAEQVFLEKVAPQISSESSITGPGTSPLDKKDTATTPVESHPAEEAYPGMQELLQGALDEQIAQQESVQALEAEPVKTAEETDEDDLLLAQATLQEGMEDALSDPEEKSVEETSSTLTESHTSPSYTQEPPLSRMEEGSHQEESAETEYSDQEEEETEEAKRENESNKRRPIATFFSINDKFRFRRELFSNSNPQWLDALALLETFADLSEALDYLIGELEWDQDSDDVTAFIDIITRYYDT